MARFPGGRHGSFRWVMIPGNEPTRRRPLRRHHDRHRSSSGRRSRGSIGRDDMADDDELGTMIGRFKRADGGQRRAARLHRARTPPTRSSPRASRRACPPTIVGNGAELPALRPAARARRVRAAAGRGVDPPARAVPLPRRRRPRARPRPARPTARGVAGTRPRRRDRADAVGDRPLAGVKVLDFTAFWAGPVRDRVARARWAPT